MLVALPILLARLRDTLAAGLMVFAVAFAGFGGLLAFRLGFRLRLVVARRMYYRTQRTWKSAWQPFCGRRSVGQTQFPLDIVPVADNCLVHGVQGECALHGRGDFH